MVAVRYATDGCAAALPQAKRHTNGEAEVRPNSRCKACFRLGQALAAAWHTMAQRGSDCRSLTAAITAISVVAAVVQKLWVMETQRGLLLIQGYSLSTALPDACIAASSRRFHACVHPRPGPRRRLGSVAQPAFAFSNLTVAAWAAIAREPTRKARAWTPFQTISASRVSSTRLGAPVESQQSPLWVRYGSWSRRWA
ncbi:hypothetical protein LZ30DRAFT_278306 [Colletotrichum cereale]|nr:hypothetical protein LZ30DRAFT_278306 [Colletotrichum cereale]